MSAVSSESPLAATAFSAPSATPSTPARPGESAVPGTAPASADFGPNEWLVDELYQRYLEDPGSVDKAWWSFFADYRPVRGLNGTGPMPVLAEPPAAVSPAAVSSAAAPPAAAPPAPGPATAAAPQAAPAPAAPAGLPAKAPAGPSAAPPPGDAE